MPEASQINNRRIAKNTFMLYIRMIFVMAVTLFTTRVILRNLGAEDYGIYNVVGGIVAMLSFLNSAMTSATQRFLNYELGKNRSEELQNVFCQAVLIHYLIAGGVFLLSETVGLWFVNTQLNIPADRFSAALWVYQFAVFSFIVNIVMVPYTASIIAHERMNVYAWVSILDVILKLGIAYLISIVEIDKLKVYALLIFLSVLVVNSTYRIYSRRNFAECHYQFVFERRKFAEMFSFAGWNLIGNIAYSLRTQGSNILLNIFFGPAVNAARGVAHQVDSAVMQFVTNFQTASNPQIVKSYAVGQYKDVMKLVCQCSKFSFFLLFIISLPLYFQIEYVLSVWLVDVPAYTPVFVQLMLLNGLIDSLSLAIKTYIKATGKVKWYMIIQGGFYLLALPVIWIFLKLGYTPESSLVVLVVFTFLGTFLRLYLAWYIGKGFSISMFLKRVIVPSTFVCIVAGIFAWYIHQLLPDGTLFLFIVKTLVFVLCTSLVILAIGMSKGERLYVYNIFKNKLRR